MTDRIDLLESYAASHTKGLTSPYPAFENSDVSGGADDYYVQTSPETLQSTYERIVGPSTWRRSRAAS